MMNNGGLFIAFALFFVLFFPLNPGLAAVSGGIGYSLFWRLPALVLVLLLMSGKSAENSLPAPPLGLRLARDAAALGLAFPVLCLLGVGASFLAEKTGFPAPPLIRPQGVAAWVSVILACLTVGYLEEGYFRVYLPRQCAVLGKAACFWFPVLLFGFCHLYEGPWGFANALLAAVMLSLVYRKTLSLHGIALAHGLYNITAYLLLGNS
jgi:membrane protease YdiL (CAAX protease family)